ncbi:hypothetical protein LIT25_23895 [Bacillus sp. F19]|nr:hypothetical protein LIT25_23895 [Bacillus sp. F19]
MNKTKHPLYSTWKNMMARCYLESNSNYKYYGGKSVQVEERWHDFWSFTEDIDNHLENGHLLYKKEYQLDKDINGGNIYSLRNCKVITADLNNKLSNEKKQRVIIAYNDIEEVEFPSVLEASEQLGISRRSIQYGIKNGWKSRTGYWLKYAD